MATQTSLTTTSASTAVIGMREDLSDVITRIDPAETPMTSWFGSGTAANTTSHEWETVSLRAPRRSPAPEGNAATTSTAKVAVRLKNVCEIIQEQYAISGSVEAANVAGSAGKMEFQRLHKGLELRKDLELAILGPQGYVATDPREMAGIQAYAENFNVGVGGTGPTTGASAGSTDVAYGTEQALDVDLMNTVLQAAWIDGARIGMFNMSSAQKLALDNALPVDSLADNNVDLKANGITVATTVGIWKSTWGDIKFVMNRILDEAPGGWGQQVINGFDERQTYRPKICLLPGRGWGYEPLGKRGDLKEELMTWEGTVECVNPRSIITIGALSDAYAS
jgi:hypothetical protein